MSGFWRNWLTIWCWAVGLFGLTLTGAAAEITSGPVRLLFDIFNGPGELDLDAHMRFSVALLGAVTLGWSLTFAAAFQAAHMLGDRSRPVWIMITASVVGWYAIDSSLSIATGFPLNAASNTILFAAYLVPVIASGVLRTASQAPRST